ncbi:MULTISPECIES: UrcA family protein [Hyphomonas]|jgi:UrcA family protein|uniref:UrcA family protein n=1 Tax=Hyphomonas TaxID=85 RepID=UPI003515D01E
MIRIFTALAVAASVAAAPAFAASDEFKMEIDVNRTQLETVVGAQEEYDRIRDEVNARCDAEHAAYKFAKDLVVRKCERQMMKKVVAYVDHDTFTNVHYQSN